MVRITEFRWIKAILLDSIRDNGLKKGIGDFDNVGYGPRLEVEEKQRPLSVRPLWCLHTSIS
jgi:hypothetical protein